MTTTPDYNDGAVHWWDSADSPLGIHPKTTVRVLDPCVGTFNSLAQKISWRMVSAFQVIKQHVEPREWWVNVYEDGTSGVLHKTEQEAVSMFESRHRGTTIRVAELPKSDT
tara:strand:- start:734 stop:1066 length:333 start_codon:yes stop_codon:yes gene_type:complete